MEREGGEARDALGRTGGRRAGPNEGGGPWKGSEAVSERERTRKPGKREPAASGPKGIGLRDGPRQPLSPRPAPHSSPRGSASPWP